MLKPIPLEPHPVIPQSIPPRMVEPLEEDEDMGQWVVMEPGGSQQSPLSPPGVSVLYPVIAGLDVTLDLPTVSRKESSSQFKPHTVNFLGDGRTALEPSSFSSFDGE